MLHALWRVLYLYRFALMFNVSLFLVRSCDLQALRARCVAPTRASAASRRGSRPSYCLFDAALPRIYWKLSTPRVLAILPRSHNKYHRVPSLALASACEISRPFCSQDFEILGSFLHGKRKASSTHKEAS